MTLAAFIRSDKNKIVAEWEGFARSLSASKGMGPLALRDHIEEILVFVANDIETSQTGKEQARKSKGGKIADLSEDSAAEAHAALRHAGGFNMDQMVSEYRALRASVIKLWSANKRDASIADLSEITRFNEAIDQALTVSIAHYSHKVEASRNLFLGILGHDLKNPLGASNMCAQLLLKIGGFDDRTTTYLAHIAESTDRALTIVASLLDLTSARLGSGIPVVKGPMDMGFVCRQLIDEMRSLHPGRIFTALISGEAHGNWDKARIGQVLSNLLGNATQYAFSDSPITLELHGNAEEVVLSVHNYGLPIPPENRASIFGSFSRGAGEHTQDGAGFNLGLGLYIVKEVVEAHGGTLSLASSEPEGTKFTAVFPRVG